MKDIVSSIKIYKTAIDGNWKQTVCRAKLLVGAMTGGESERMTRLLQSKLGISYDAANSLVASIFTRPSGISQ